MEALTIEFWFESLSESWPGRCSYDCAFCISNMKLLKLTIYICLRSIYLPFFMDYTYTLYEAIGELLACPLNLNNHLQPYHDEIISCQHLCMSIHPWTWSAKDIITLYKAIGELFACPLNLNGIHNHLQS